MSNSITVDQVGRRHYFLGNTYGIKDQLRAAGCKWDSDRKAWYTGKASTAAKFSGISAPSTHTEVTGDNLSVLGTATYKGKTYYVVWAGETSRGFAFKLAFRDGSSVFWAKQENGQPVWVKRYREAATIGRLKRFIERAKAEEVTYGAKTQYTSEGYRILPNGTHQIRVQGSRGMYWKNADDRDQFDEFDN